MGLLKQTLEQGRVKTPKAPGHWTCGGPPLVVNEIAPQKVKKYILEKICSFVKVNVLYFGDLGEILGSTFNIFCILGGF